MIGRQAVHINPTALEQNPDAIQDIYAEVETILATLPPLAEILRLPPGKRDAALRERLSLLGVATLHPDSLLLLSRLFQDVGLDMAARLIVHAASFHASDKEKILKELPGGRKHVQKSVTLLLDGKLLLVTSFGGDCTLGKKEKKAIVKRLGLAPDIPHQFRFNPPNCVPEEEFYQLRGDVNPFIHPGLDTQLQGIVHLPWSPEWNDHDVAVSISPRESLLCPISKYPYIVCEFVQQRIPLLFL